MSLGLIARADNTGLGTQSWEFHRHLRPAKTLIVDLAGRSASGKDLTIYPDRFGHGEVTTVTGVPDDATLDAWLDGLTTVFTMETPYNYRLYSIARHKGIQTVLQGNWELLDYLQPGPHQHHLPDILALPSTWHLRQARRRLGDRMEVLHLPVPIATDRFTVEDPPETATRLLHVAGHPATHDRNGTTDLLAAVALCRAEMTVTLTCQRPGWLGSLIGPDQSPPNVTLVIDPATPTDYWSLYPGQHAVVLPRRYGGLCLPLNEALGAHLPVLMPAISPNTDWLPTDWLTPAEQYDSFLAKTPVEVYRSDPVALAERMDRLATDPEFYAAARRSAAVLADRYSWETLLPDYRKILS